ncbi:MAG: type II toxin-antitoxin system PemK/MazF family toxin [Chlamydiae bacterium]|nr:type II toxin-antitoxin system PemK/MazF family toxin [Chlamydiota bacterium]MBI3266681.1 type II toxin-antitoxin system PemK/MazF family toxin [Chlamydiota bacterium]
MNLSQGDIVLTVFPYTDLTSQKVRPAVVLSTTSYNLQEKDVILCLVTSNIRREGSFLIRIDTSHPDYHPSGFKKPSAIIVDKIHSLHHSLIKRKLGSLGKGTLREVEHVLKDILFNHKSVH